MKTKMGILGLGMIARLMAQTVAQMGEAEIYAVASRSPENAEEFAREFGAAKAYGSYEGMLADPEVELVYIATPHSHHCAQVKMCLEHGKHVLCEKAFTTSGVKAREMLALAQQKGLLLTEAMWIRYMPFCATLQRLLAEGVIGRVNGLSANLGYHVTHKPRMLEPALAGGALLDLGVYTLNFAYMMLGTGPHRVTSDVVLYHTGVDAQETIALHYENGLMAALYATILGVTDRQGIIYGDEGFMVVENINNPESARVYDNQRRMVREYARPPQLTGYEYEVQAAIQAIRAGAVECAEMPHAETIRIMDLMEELRLGWGVPNPA